MPHRFRRFILLAVLTLAALWLRTTDLARRPMHADEANQAVKTGELLEHGRYQFDPTDHHGPTLYYAALPIAWLRGQTTLAELDETTVRLVPALAGTLSVLLLFAFVVGCASRPDSATSGANPFGLAIAAAAFFAVAPPAVYYSRYFVQETLLLTFTLAALVSAQRWWRTGRIAWALAVGASLGLMQATKASAPIFVTAALLPLAFVLRQHETATPTRRPFTRDLALAVFAALIVAALFYSSFGRNPAGLRDALATYTHAAGRATGDSGHEKPWWYYLQLLTWTRDGGLVFQQLAFTALACAGAALAWTGRAFQVNPNRPPPPYALLRWAALYTLIVTAVLSFTPYKTPWHVIHLLPGLALLAAGALAAMPRPWIAALLASAVVFLQYKQTELAVFLRPADGRNPFAYVHSSSDVLKLRALADAALERQSNGVIRVISEEYWPMPWYFRGLPQVGYWTSPPNDVDGALVIASAAQSEAVRERLRGRYRESILGLRPGFLCVVFTPES